MYRIPMELEVLDCLSWNLGGPLTKSAISKRLRYQFDEAIDYKALKTVLNAMVKKRALKEVKIKRDIGYQLREE